MTVQETLFLFLPEADDAPLAWLRAEDGHIVGEGDDWQGGAGEARVIALAPARTVSLALVDLPALAPAQAAAAARTLLEDRLRLAGAEAHIGMATGDGPRPAAWVARTTMEGWMARLKQHGVTPAALIPANALLPLPDEGLIRYQIGANRVVAGAGTAWIDDPALTAAMHAAPPVDQSSDRVSAALLNAADAPPLDFLSGPFAVRQPWGVASPALRLPVILLALLALVSVLLPLAQAWSLHRSAARLESEAAQIAKKAYPQAADPLAALAQDGAMRGQFLNSYAAIADVLSSHPGSDLGALTLRADGALEVQIRARDRETLRKIYAAIGAKGKRVNVGVESLEQGRSTAKIQVSG